ncbi:hypothetical protein JCGZ_18617 [Jatropha curcas]|uniref:Uncharacterized protein n=1 Tax=Jatropha curcas TaxID=180498 RepID=A0A067K1E1_JATCU|nr:hypothetical protein JCGZ_18617 [Jatropha curcas]
MHTCRTLFNSEISLIELIHPEKRFESLAPTPWLAAAQNIPNPEFIPVSSVNYPSSSDLEPDSDSVEMADDIGGESGFSQAQMRTIAQIVAAALAQDRA